MSYLQNNIIKTVGTSKALTAIITFSGIIFFFLLWLVYFKESIGYSSEIISYLPAFNAFCNSLSAIFLSMGFMAIKKRKKTRHMKFMISAFVCSALFLISYIIYHTFHGDTSFTGTGFVRPVYFIILITHIILSAVVVPMILSSFYFSLSGKFAAHKKISRFTLPIWLYVSVTGVLIFIFLKTFS